MKSNRRLRTLTFAGIVMASMSAPEAQAQFGRRWQIEQNDPPATELIVARWRFGTNGAIGHMGWAHNYPNSDQNFNEFIDQSTGVDVQVASYRIVELGSDEVFLYPFAYVSEPGEMELTEGEVENFRQFIDRGGFVLMDDFDGLWQFETMRSQVARVFPERPLIRLEPDHALFKAHFDLYDLNGMAPYVPGGSITYYGILNDAGDVVVAAGHNNDLANFWDWYDQARMPLEPAADAFRLGINFVVWSMTH